MAGLPLCTYPEKNRIEICRENLKQIRTKGRGAFGSCTASLLASGKLYADRFVTGQLFGQRIGLAETGI